jgi:hypothetical protein
MKILFCTECPSCKKLIELPETYDWREVDESDIEVFCSKVCEEISRSNFRP